MRKLNIAILVGAMGALGLGCAAAESTPDDAKPVDLSKGEPGSEPVDQDQQPVEDLDGFILGLGHLVPAEMQAKTEITCDGVCPADGQEGEVFCTYKRFTETEQFERFVAFQPNSATLWPGAVVRGQDARNGVLTPIGVPRAPLTFSISLENIAGSPVGHMAEPSLSAFREERNRILADDVTGATPAALDFTVTEVYSESQLSLALGASVSWPGGGEIAGSFNFDSQEKKTKIVVNFTQAYYTIDIDTPLTPKEFFAPGVTLAQLQQHMGLGNPPMYVQSITFGRRVIFSVETNESAENIAAALSATYAGAVDVSADVSFEHQQMLQESSIKAFVIGGSGGDATGVIDGFDGLITYIRNGGNYSKDSPGSAIAYKLAYLDNAVTKFAFTTEYSERHCVKNRATLRAELKGIDHVGGGDPGSNIEIYGYVAIAAPVGGNDDVTCAVGGEVYAIWELQYGQWLTMPEFSYWTPPSPVYVSIDDVAVGPGKKVCLFSEFAEEDTLTNEFTGNDYYGYDSRLISFEEGWEIEHVLQPRGTGENALDVSVRLSLSE